MNDCSVRRWLMLGALGAGLVLGCDHGSRLTASKHSTKPPIDVARNDKPIDSASSPMVSQKSSEASTMSGGSAPWTQLVKPDPEIVQARRDVPAAASATSPTPAKISGPSKEQSHYQSGVIYHVDPAPSFVVPEFTPPPTVVRFQQTVQPPEIQPTRPMSPLAHAEDYSWLCGRVEHDFKKRSAWRVRYLSIDETDEYGGALTLVEDERLQGWKEGMIVRVWGQLSVDSAASGSAKYHVDNFKVLQLNESLHSTSWGK